MRRRPEGHFCCRSKDRLCVSAIRTQTSYTRSDYFEFRSFREVNVEQERLLQRPYPVKRTEHRRISMTSKHRKGADLAPERVSRAVIIHSKGCVKHSRSPEVPHLPENMPQVIEGCVVDLSSRCWGGVEYVRSRHHAAASVPRPGTGNPGISANHAHRSTMVRWASLSVKSGTCDLSDSRKLHW